MYGSASIIVGFFAGAGRGSSPHGYVVSLALARQGLVYVSAACGQEQRLFLECPGLAWLGFSSDLKVSSDR
jgi:hypothetical protein